MYTNSSSFPVTDSFDNEFGLAESHRSLESAARSPPPGLGLIKDHTLIKIGLFVALLSAVFKIVVLSRKRRFGSLPPGPKGLPLIGNVADLPPAGAREWEHWKKHKDLYGPISSVTVAGTTMVMLHSADIAAELFEKRSAIYSSRPRHVFAGEMLGWANGLVCQPYGHDFRQMRKAFHGAVGTKSAITPYLALQEAEVHRFLFRVLEKPEELVKHIRTEVGAIILKIAYGYTVEPHKPDPLVRLADKALDHFSAAMIPGAWLVDVIPALRYIPEWIPGASFKRTAREWRATVRDVTEKPVQLAKRRIAEGRPTQSLLSDMYSRKGDAISAKEDSIIKWSAISLYGGGTDTSVVTMHTFFLAMTLYPEAQRRAQEEIDRVVGSDRLPTFNDRAHLPYVEALVTEALRWHPVLPMGLPHVTTAEDTINGYRIPKGALVIPNIWWFTHDPAIYPDPMTFNPLRHLGPNHSTDPREFVFGFGRRLCPGRHLADASVWLTIARSLAVFDISKGLDENCIEIEPSLLFSSGLISHPEAFKATIKPRSSRHEALIREVESLHPWEKSDAPELGSIGI